MPAPLTPDVILFDLYNTLIDIRTNEHDPADWDKLARYLRYRGVYAEGQALHDAYFAAMKSERALSGEAHPEIDGVGLFRHLLDQLGYEGEDADDFAFRLFQLYRVLTIRHFALFDDTLPVLRTLREHFQLGIVSDAQLAFFEPELEEAGLADFFDVRVVTSEFGFRKPDPRLFNAALTAFEVPAGESCFIGDNPKRDALGAQQVGITGVWLRRAGGYYGPPDSPPDYEVRDLYQFQALLDV